MRPDLFVGQDLLTVERLLTLLGENGKRAVLLGLQGFLDQIPHLQRERDLVPLGPPPEAFIQGFFQDDVDSRVLCWHFLLRPSVTDVMHLGKAVSFGQLRQARRLLRLACFIWARVAPSGTLAEHSCRCEESATRQPRPRLLRLRLAMTIRVARRQDPCLLKFSPSP